jgi:hypothetical protein
MLQSDMNNSSENQLAVGSWQLAVRREPTHCQLIFIVSWRRITTRTTPQEIGFQLSVLTSQPRSGD